MRNFLFRLATKLWPGLETMSEQRRLVGVGDVVVFIYAAPLAIAGIVWLMAVTDVQLLRQNWQPLLLLGALIFLFNQLSYFIIIQIRTDRYGSADGSLASMIQWSAAFLFGPTALWLSIIWLGVIFLRNHIRARSIAARWNLLRGFTLEIAVVSLAYPIALFFYQRWGGVIPIPGLTPGDIFPALGALLVHFLLVILIWIGYVAYAVWLQRVLHPAASIRPVIVFSLLALGLPILSHPFSILAAGIYVQNGIAVYLFLISGLLLVAYLARQLSWSAESSRQQSRQLDQLEHLGREIINSPPDASGLSNVLDEHVPTMFPSARIAIWISPDRLLLINPADWSLEIEPIWHWARAQTQARAFLAKEKLPWAERVDRHDPVVTAPILNSESVQPMGVIYMELRSLAQPWDMRALASLFPAVHTLAAQVASALQHAEAYEETLTLQQISQELAFAGRIQASFLPNELPSLNGWELAVTLLPARETSGDFFDFIPLADGKLGILIADVADKGIGAALYMALSRTLIRTYALEYVDSQPDIVFFSSNERILKDARAHLFVTAFYGILDQAAGTLTYCNAGHNPPYLLSAGNGPVRELPATGMPIGIEEDAVWTQATIKIDPGDVLLLYTDGIPDAQNSEGKFFKEKRLVDVAQENLDRPAQEMQIAILDAVQDFVGNAPQFDDITLLVLIRDR